MRKYFLLTSAALLAATSANATTDYAEVTAKATIEVAGSIYCNDIDFGTIVVKQNNEESTVTMDSDSGNVYTDGDILSVSNSGPYFYCSDGDGMEISGPSLSFPASIVLENGEVGEMTVNLSLNGAERIDAVLNIPSQVQSGDYSTSFTVTHTL